MQCAGLSVQCAGLSVQCAVDHFINNDDTTIFWRQTTVGLQKMVVLSLLMKWSSVQCNECRIECDDMFGAVSSLL